MTLCVSWIRKVNNREKLIFLESEKELIKDEQ